VETKPPEAREASCVTDILYGTLRPSHPERGGKERNSKRKEARVIRVDAAVVAGTIPVVRVACVPEERFARRACVPSRIQGGLERKTQHEREEALQGGRPKLCAGRNRLVKIRNGAFLCASIERIRERTRVTDHSRTVWPSDQQ